jgi:coenzyme F420-reducing hydrogenase beta subunit
MDKNMHRFSREQLKAMVEEFESNSYEVNKMQMSMINKLKFMAKTSDRSVSKDALIRKDRSIIK